MKKILAVIIFAAGIFFAQPVQAYQLENGDQAWDMFYQCVYCNRRGEQLSIYGKAMVKDDCPETGCPRNGSHYWRPVVLVIYRYQNGQWTEISRTHY